MDNDRFDGQSQLDQLGIPEHTGHGHPVAEGAAWFLSVVIVRHYARAYLERIRSPRSAQAFFRHADRRLWTGVTILTVALLVAIFLAYMSLGAAQALLAAGVIGFILLVVPPGVQMVRCAYREVKFRRQSSVSAASRLLQ